MANYARVANFGNPLEQDWQKNNLVTVVAPNGQRFVVHKDAAPSFQGLLNDLGQTGYDIKSDGGFNYRNIRGGDTLSQHAFGNAIDINAATNGLGSRTTDMPANITDMAENRGLEWGGNWKSRPDPMHFEWTGKPVTTVNSPAADGFEMPSQTPPQMQPTMLARANTPDVARSEIAQNANTDANDTIKLAGYDVSKSGIKSLLDGIEQMGGGSQDGQSAQRSIAPPQLATNDVTPVAQNLLLNTLRRRMTSGLI